MQLTFDDIHVLKTPAQTAGSTLRPYQSEALYSCLAALDDGEHPVLNLPTGSGKSHLIAALAATLDGRILVVTHRKELIRQDHAKHQGSDAGIYSAGLGVRDTTARVVYAGIGSIYRRMDVLQAAGNFRYVLCDEAHRIGPRSVASMYSTVLDACPDAQRIGLTATPYRLNEGLLHQREDAWFTCLPVDVSIRDLTPEYLAPLVGVLGAAEIDVSQVKSRMGEYVPSELAQVACEEAAVEGAVAEICALTPQRQRCIVFCVDVAHTRLVCEALQRHGQAAAFVVGTTPAEERETLLQDFAGGAFKFLVNCEVATTGYDCPTIDCVVLLRPTQSRGLLVQMIGRGSRQAPGKETCLVLDYSGSLERHQPLDDLTSLDKSSAREAAEDAAREASAQRERDRRAKHAREASLVDPMGRHVDVCQTYRVARMAYKVLEAKRYPGRYMLLAMYTCPMRLPHPTVTQFVLVEHDGWAREQAERWGQRRGLTLPLTAKAALRLAWSTPTPQEIVVREDAQYPKIVIERFPEASSTHEDALW